MFINRLLPRISMISKKIIKNELKTYSVRITWSDENNGDLDSNSIVRANSIEEAFNEVFSMFKDPKKLEKEGTFYDENTFSYETIMDEATLELVLLSELDEEDYKYNEDGEIENYIRTYTISIYEDEE
jgi:hypothetical protein